MSDQDGVLFGALALVDVSSLELTDPFVGMGLPSWAGHRPEFELGEEMDILRAERATETRES